MDQPENIPMLHLKSLNFFKACSKNVSNSPLKFIFWIHNTAALSLNLILFKIQNFTVMGEANGYFVYVM